MSTSELFVGFVAGQWIDGVHPTQTLGDAFSPLVGLGVAVILFGKGLRGAAPTP